MFYKLAICSHWLLFEGWLELFLFFCFPKYKGSYSCACIPAQAHPPTPTLTNPYAPHIQNYTHALQINYCSLSKCLIQKPFAWGHIYANTPPLLLALNRAHKCTQTHSHALS